MKPGSTDASQAPHETWRLLLFQVSYCVNVQAWLPPTFLPLASTSRGGRWARGGSHLTCMPSLMRAPSKHELGAVFAATFLAGCSPKDQWRLLDKMHGPSNLIFFTFNEFLYSFFIFLMAFSSQRKPYETEVSLAVASPCYRTSFDSAIVFFLSTV